MLTRSCSCALVALLALALAACGELPRPFQPADKGLVAQRLYLKQGAGVHVTRIEGLAPRDSARLAETMAEALRAADVAASTRSSNRDSYFLAGAVERWAVKPGERWRVTWDLADRSGRILGSRVLETHVSAQGADDRALAALVRPAADDVAELIQPDPGGAAPPPRWAVALRPIAGAPGDGAMSLRRALERRLAAGPFLLVAEATEAAVVVAGEVKLGPGQSGRQEVSVTWRVSGPDGAALGTVDQGNMVPIGLLDGAWGTVADAIAAGAVDGIVDLVERVPLSPPKL